MSGLALKSGYLCATIIERPDIECRSGNAPWPFGRRRLLHPEGCEATSRRMKGGGDLRMKARVQTGCERLSADATAEI